MYNKNKFKQTKSKLTKVIKSTSKETKKRQFKYLESNNSAKLNLDQYYTSEQDMLYCVNKTLDILQANNKNVTCYLEPSAGTGIFSNYLITSGLEVLAMDIEPKCEDIIKADFLTFPLEYKVGRLVIGNPPFGSRLSLAQKFYKKSVEIADYISFILPISQLNNTQSLYEFDLLYSEDLGKLIFSGNRKVHCCLNIYVRPKSGLINRKKQRRLKDITIVRQDSKQFKDFDYDLRMCYWGDAKAGKLLDKDEHYSAEYKIKINNIKLKDNIIEVLKTVDWRKELNCTAMLKIQQFHILDVLRKYVDGIE